MWPNQSTGPSLVPSPALLSPLPRQEDGQARQHWGSEDPHTLQGEGRGCMVLHTADASPGVRGAVLHCLGVPHLSDPMGQGTHPV